MQATIVKTNNKAIVMFTRKCDKSKEIVNNRRDELEKRTNNASTKWLQNCLGELVKVERRTPKVINKNFKKVTGKCLYFFAIKKKHSQLAAMKEIIKMRQMNKRGVVALQRCDKMTKAVSG